jgi:hypothetical protein
MDYFGGKAFNLLKYVGKMELLRNMQNHVLMAKYVKICKIKYN